MTRLLLSIAAFLFFSPVSLGAADLSGLYSLATLEYWKTPYERSTTKIFEQVIQPALFAHEKERIGNIILDFRLYGEGRTKEHPLQFYVAPDNSRVVMPIASLKFLDDLCTAYAWLQIKGYTLETISEYTGVLRYRDFPGGRYPRPLKTLQIPDDALNDPQVSELALGHFVTARTFILLHELGHVFYGHRGSNIANEKEADAFAATVMSRTGLPPLGVIVFFLFDAHWSSYPPSPNDTHPLSGDRLRALAAHVEDPGLAGPLRALGELMDDPDIRAGFAAAGLSTDIAALAPRRPEEMPRAGVKSVSTNSVTAAFHRKYVGHSVQFTEPKLFPIQVVLQRRGDRVDGQYSFGIGIGTVSGRTAGDVLNFEWEWAKYYGRGMFKSNGDGSAFSGTWGYRESADNGGTWNGRRSN